MGVLAELTEPATVLYIARWARCSDRTVRNVLLALDAAGSLVTDTSHGFPYRYMLKGTGLAPDAEVYGGMLTAPAAEVTDETIERASLLIGDMKAAGGQLSRFTPPELPDFGVPERIEVTYLTMPGERP